MTIVHEADKRNTLLLGMHLWKQDVKLVKPAPSVYYNIAYMMQFFLYPGLFEQ